MPQFHSLFDSVASYLVGIGTKQAKAQCSFQSRHLQLLRVAQVPTDAVFLEE